MVDATENVGFSLQHSPQPNKVISASTSTQRSTNNTSAMKRNCLLITIGILLICSTLLSISIGHYHYIQEVSSSVSLRLQDFLGDDKQSSDKADINTTSSINTTTTNINIEDPSRHERIVFESIIQRVKWTKDQCDSIPLDQRHTVKKEIKTATDLPMLPEGGVAIALETWLKDNPISSTSNMAIIMIIQHVIYHQLNHVM